MSHALVVMGVSGAGKSTLGRALAATFGWAFVEGDSLHPPANVAKMAAGIALTDEDRWPFLEGVARAVLVGRAGGVVVACSALKRSYRDFIRARAGGPVTFVLPMLDRQRLLARMGGRRGHFMPASLLESQLATLEVPGPDEGAIVVDGFASTDAQVATVRDALSGQ